MFYDGAIITQGSMLLKLVTTGLGNKKERNKTLHRFGMQLREPKSFQKSRSLAEGWVRRRYQLVGNCKQHALGQGSVNSEHVGSSEPAHTGEIGC
ncbi:hypothetical protein V6N13_092723 [Hibiscus sabdariffa]